MKIIKWVAFFSALLPALAAQAQTYYITDKVLVGVYEQANVESTLLTTLPTGTPLELLDRLDNFVKVRGPDGSSGWIEKAYMIEHKPAQLVVLELTDKQQQANEQLALTQAELRAVQEQAEKLKHADNSAEEIEELSRQRKELGVQLDRLRNQIGDERKKLTAANTHIAALKQQVAKLQQSAPSADEDTLQAFSADSERLLAENRNLLATLKRVRDALALPPTQPAGVVKDGGIQIKMTWLWTGILMLIVIGFVAGMKWLDWRNLRRHGGFRI